MSSMKKQEEQTKNICLLKKDGFTLYLVKEGDSFTDIKNGVVSILPEELIAKRKSGGNISTDIENYAHKLKRQEYGKKLNYQIENLLFLTGAGSSYLLERMTRKANLCVIYGMMLRFCLVENRIWMPFAKSQIY